MIEKLIKRLQERKFSEQEEQVLIAEMEHAKEIIDQNKEQRKREAIVLEEINKDENKVKRLNEIDSKIKILESKLDNYNPLYMILAVIMTVVCVAGSIGAIILSIKIFASLVLQALSPFLSIALCFAVGYPLKNYIEKKQEHNHKELLDLLIEKQAIFDEIEKKIDFSAPEIAQLKNVAKLSNIEEERTLQDTLENGI